MIELAAVLTPILLADLLNPVLFAFMVYAAGKDLPVRNCTSLLLGHTVAYFFAGILIALGLEQAMERLTNPKRIDYVIQLVIGLIVLWVAFRSREDTGQRPDEENLSLTPLRSFGLGAIVNFIGIPFAVPYFAALGQILKADLSEVEAIIALSLYNIVYALPFAAVPLLVAVLGNRSRPILIRINGYLERISAYLMPVVLVLVGLALTIDAIVYLTIGLQLI